MQKYLNKPELKVTKGGYLALVQKFFLLVLSLSLSLSVSLTLLPDEPLHLPAVPVPDGPVQSVARVGLRAGPPRGPPGRNRAQPGAAARVVGRGGGGGRRRRPAGGPCGSGSGGSGSGSARTARRRHRGDRPQVGQGGRGGGRGGAPPSPPVVDLPRRHPLLHPGASSSVFPRSAAAEARTPFSVLFVFFLL